MKFHSFILIGTLLLSSSVMKAVPPLEEPQFPKDPSEYPGEYVDEVDMTCELRKRLNRLEYWCEVFDKIVRLISFSPRKEEAPPDKAIASINARPSVQQTEIRSPVPPPIDIPD